MRCWTDWLWTSEGWMFEPAWWGQWRPTHPPQAGFFVLAGNVLSILREPISLTFRCSLLSCSSSISSRLFNAHCRHNCLSQRSSKVKLKAIRKSMKSTFSWVLLFSIISIGDASIRAKAFTTHPAYSANRLEIFDGDKTEIRGCNGYAGPLKNPKPSINSAQSVKIFMHAGILGIQLLWAGFLSRRMVLLGRIHTLAIRKSTVGFLGRWKIIRQFLFNLILNQVVGKQVMAMASSIQFRKMEWGYGVFLSTLEKDADLIEQKKWPPIVNALLVLMLSCFVPKLIGRQRHPPARWRGQLADGDCFLWLLKNEYVSLLTLLNPFVIFVMKPRLGSFGFLGRGAVLRIGLFFFMA